MTDNEIKRIVEFLERMEPEVHRNAVEKGFWGEKQRDPATKFATIGEEIGEFVGAMRKPGPCSKPGLEHLSNTEEELADIVIRCLDWKGYARSEGNKSGKNWVNYHSTEYWGYTLRKNIMDVVCNMFAAAGSHASSNIIAMSFRIAERLKIDLPAAIEAKHGYNLGREYLHGKEF